MLPEEKELLKKSIALEEENNHILKGIRRSMRISRIISIIYWVLIIGSAIGAFYLVQPYIDFLVNSYGGAKNTLDASVGNLSGILDTFKGLNN